MKRQVRSTVIRGSRWMYKEVPASRCTVEGERVRGYCDYAHKALVISKKLEGEEKLEVIVHEFLHAAFPDLNDDCPEGPVYATARDLARLLTRLGYDLTD